MGMARFIGKKFIGKELYLYLGEEAETITLEQTWVPNKEVIHGIVREVDEDVLIFEMLSGPTIYINGDEVKMCWEKDFDYHKCAEGSLTRRLPGAKNKDNRR